MVRADFERRTWFRLNAWVVPGEIMLIIGPLSVAVQDWNGLRMRHD
jgi:hypothetical protein